MDCFDEVTSNRSQRKSNKNGRKKGNFNTQMKLGRGLQRLHMGSGFAKKKKEARLFQQKFQEMQDKFKESTAHGSAGNGLVELTLNGDYEMTKLKIKPECVDPEDVEGLEDLIRAAYNEAAKKLSDEMPSMPPGFGGMGSFSV